MQTEGTTHSALIDAFVDEASTVQRYTAFAWLAEAEGHTEIATLFRELAEASACNAQGHLDWLRRMGDPMTDLPIGPTEQNLRAALAAEARESTTQYPDRSRRALEEGQTDIANWLDCMATYKRSHLDRFTQALRLLTDGATP